MKSNVSLFYSELRMAAPQIVFSMWPVSMGSLSALQHGRVFNRRKLKYEALSYASW